MELNITSMKKNLFWSMLAILMVTMLSVGLAACGDDDDNPVVGTWSGQQSRHNLTLTFKSDGTGTFISRYNDSYSGMETSSGNFTYVMEVNNKGIINIRLYDSYSGYGYETIFFVIEGKTMSLYDDYYYDDLEWVLTKQ